MGDVTQRVGDVERDGAVQALREHLAAGRISSAEYEERSLAARAARTRGDLDELFADLPVTGPGARSGAGSEPRPAVAERGGWLPPAYGEWLLRLTPPVALLLFFTTWRWQWFLAIPIMALVVGGPHRGRSAHGWHQDRSARRQKGCS